MIKRPVNQVRLTNVVVVRYKRSGKRFEVACYPNKVIAFRNGIEKILDEVVHTTQVFTNVSKGELAKKSDLKKVFGAEMSDEDICLEIVKKGEMQVSDLERQQQSQQLFRDVCHIVAQKCVNKQTMRPFPVGMIEKASKNVHFAVKLNKSAKQQALVLIEKLKTLLPIERGRMRLRLIVPFKEGRKCRQRLKQLDAVVEQEDRRNHECFIECVIEPGHYRAVDQLIRECAAGVDAEEGDAEDATPARCTLEMLSMFVTDVGGDDDLSSEAGDGENDDDDVASVASDLSSRLKVKGERSTDANAAADAAAGKKGRRRAEKGKNADVEEESESTTATTKKGKKKQGKKKGKGRRGDSDSDDE